MNEWMDACMHARTGGGTDGWMDGGMGGWMDGWMEGWVDGWMEGWVDEKCKCNNN